MNYRYCWKTYLENIFEEEQMDFEQIKYLIIDVDGTMTDAGIYYDDHGNELKKFCTRDAAGFFAAKQAGIKIMVLTGRECQAVTRRMTELKVDFLHRQHLCIAAARRATLHAEAGAQ